MIDRIGNKLLSFDQDLLRSTNGKLKSDRSDLGDKIE